MAGATSGHVSLQNSEYVLFDVTPTSLILQFRRAGHGPFTGRPQHRARPCLAPPAWPVPSEKMTMFFDMLACLLG